MATVTKPIALDESLNTTELSSRNVADVLAQELSAVATAIGGISAPSAEDVSYDNSGSGLSATDVQNALDEIVSDIPTVNDGTLTIQQNGETKGTFTANQSGNSTVNIETPTTDIQTAVDEFETYNGGLLSECKVSLSPNQDLHGYAEPWVGGAGANQWDEEWRNGYYQLDRQASNYGQFISFANAVANKNPIPVLPSTNYTMRVVSGGTCSMFFYDSNHDPISHMLIYATPFSLTTPANCAYINFNMNANPYGATYKNDIALNYPSTVTTYSPYSNICPISGHTQVDVDVSDGQTTQEQVTVNLGGTYYSGTLDVVSGVFTPDKKGIIISDIGWSGTNGKFYSTNPISDIKYGGGRYDYVTSSGYKTANKSSLSQLADGETSVDASGYLQIKDNQYTTSASFVSDRGSIQIVYELATPLTIQLSPTMVKALVGENHLSAPLDGQEITESKYKQMFTFDDVIAYIQSLS